MNFLDGARNVVNFLTIIPLGKKRRSLTSTANYMFIFPLVGGLIGLLSALSALLFFEFIPDLVAGFLTLGFLFLITGLHHTDGLIDFGDGLMASGNPAAKIRTMRDKKIGAGGFILGSIVILVTALAISSLELVILESLIVCEISAKFSMVTGAKIGKSGHRGLNTRFIEAMKGTSGNLRFITALTISLMLVILILGLDGFISLLGGIITAIILTFISYRHFNGLTGDVFGAMNDLSRMTSLVLLLSVI